MNVAAQMLQARPDARGVDHAALALAIDALHDVVSAATTCADACLTDHGDLDASRQCIQACGDAGDVAAATAKVLCRSGPTVEGTRALVEATSKLLAECGAICGEHGIDDKHARICADTMSRAQQALAGLQTAAAAAERSDS
jgi:hypothetical protein